MKGATIMSYSEFSLDDIKHKLGLTIREVSEVFTAVEPDGITLNICGETHLTR